MAVAALVSWLVAGVAGVYMFGTWLSHGGPSRQRARSDGLPPAVIFTHLGFGALGFAAWVSYLVTGWVWLAWTAVGLLMPGIGLGICTVTLWAPYPTPPGRGAPVTEAMATHFDRCLGCMACMPACPSRVRYNELIEAARSWTEEPPAGLRPPAVRSRPATSFASSR